MNPIPPSLWPPEKLGNRCTIALCDEKNLSVYIGKNCLLGNNIFLRVSDGHTIYSTIDKTIINRPKYGIKINDHVWIGRNVTILKDVIIPKDCIIGYGSIVVNKNFDENSIIAGIPAKIVKKNINWNFYNTDFFKDRAII